MKTNKQRRKIGWLDSTGMPSHTHLTDDGIDTLCGDHAEYIADYLLVRTPKKQKGYSNLCRHCFKDGIKAVPWDERCHVFSHEESVRI